MQSGEVYLTVFKWLFTVQEWTQFDNQPSADAKPYMKLNALIELKTSILIVEGHWELTCSAHLDGALLRRSERIGGNHAAIVPHRHGKGKKAIEMGRL